MTGAPASHSPGAPATTLFDPGEADRFVLADPPAVSRPVLCMLRVVGDPVPQGSMVPFIDKHSGKARMKPSNEAELARWRKLIAEEAEVQAGEVGMLAGPLEADVVFRFRMPPSRGPKAVRVMGRTPMMVRPDADKLVRAVLDALKTGGLIVDDGQVSDVISRKREYVAGWTGVIVRLRRAALLAIEDES